MAVTEADVWWVYALESGEVSHHDNEPAAIAAAGTHSYPGYPAMILKGKSYTLVVEEEE